MPGDPTIIVKTKRFRTTSILTLSLVWTGLACYLFSIIRGLGKDTALPFFDPEDIFADFFKLVSSYPGRREIQLESWLPSGISNTINSYLSSNPYSNNPEASISSLTNFHGPPVTQIINVVTRYLFDEVGPGMSFGIHFGIIFVFLLYLVSIASRRSPLSTETILVSGACIAIYPSVFTILRGYSIAYLVNLLVCCSFLLTIRSGSYRWLPAFILSLAIGIRPNYILFLPLLIVIHSCVHPVQPKCRRIFSIIFVTLLSLSLAFLLATFLYRGYSVNTFVNAYNFYSKAYESGGVDNFWSSSLLQPGLILARIVGRITNLQLVMPSQIKLVCLSLSLFVCLWTCAQLNNAKISISQSILISSFGIILGTPVFADYHLLILLSPILVSMYFEREPYLRNPDDLNQLSNSQSTVITKIMSHRYIMGLSRADAIVIVFLTVPKALPIASDLGSIQTFLNPLAICIYLFLTIFKPRSRLLST